MVNSRYLYVSIGFLFQIQLFWIRYSGQIYFIWQPFTVESMHHLQKLQTHWWGGETLDWSNRAFFFQSGLQWGSNTRLYYSGRLYSSEVGVAVRMGEGWLFFKGKGWINGINKTGFLCLSSALSASVVDISEPLTASLTAHQISRKH